MNNENNIRQSELLAERLACYLNTNADFIEKSIIDELKNECALSAVEAFSAVLAAALGFDTEKNGDSREVFERFFPDMVHLLKTSEYRENPYYKNISVPHTKIGKWELKSECYKPYEAFVCGDLLRKADGRIIPQLGFFEEEFSYPAVLEDGREWMLITPNEIETMKGAVAASSGRVLSYGLGLGYFAYMASRKPEVKSVTLVERDKSVIKLFTEKILPQFESKEKIEIIESDAFDYAKKLPEGSFDFVFCDIWHDACDGVRLYLEMKKHEKPACRYMYWIEDTLKCYIK